MNIVRPKKKFLFLLVCSFLLSVSLVGCTKKGRLDEGVCKCNVLFADIPKEFSMLEPNLTDLFTIKITLQNTVNETMYDILLNKDNEYSTQISLHPGTYRVVSVINDMQSYNGMSVIANVDHITLSPDVTEELKIAVDNRTDFTDHWMATQPMPEILLAEKFSRQIQIHRKVINITDILPELSLTYNNPVKPYEKIELSDSELGITVTLLNNTEQQQTWSSCEVIGIDVHRNNVVFPEGVTLGMAPGTVLHKATGVYGEPDSFSGFLFHTWGLDHTKAIYRDPESGDKITVTLRADGSLIQSIRYDLACFE